MKYRLSVWFGAQTKPTSINAAYVERVPSDKETAMSRRTEHPVEILSSDILFPYYSLRPYLDEWSINVISFVTVDFHARFIICKGKPDKFTNPQNWGLK